jgi:tricorn protease-like protein
VLAGGDIYFVAEYGESANLHRMSLRERKPSRVTAFADAPVRYPETDGSRIVFEHGHGLGIYDLATKRATDLRMVLTTPVPVWINSML